MPQGSVPITATKLVTSPYNPRTQMFYLEFSPKFLPQVIRKKFQIDSIKMGIYDEC